MIMFNPKDITVVSSNIRDLYFTAPVSTDAGSSVAGAAITFFFDLSTLVEGDTIKVTLPASATDESEATSRAFELDDDYDSGDIISGLSAEWTTLNGLFDITDGILAFNYSTSGQQTDIKESAMLVVLTESMFDDKLSTQSEFANKIEIEIEFNSADRVGLFNVVGTDVVLELENNEFSEVLLTTEGGDTLTTESGDLLTTEEDIEAISIDLSKGDQGYTKTIIETLTAVDDGTLKITINNPGSVAKCGNCVYGLALDAGTAEYGLDAGYVDFGKNSTDSFGRTYLEPGKWAKRFDVRVHFDLEDVDTIYKRYRDSRGSYVVFDANQNGTDYETFRLLGFIRDWNLYINNPAIAYIDLNTQGIT